VARGGLFPGSGAADLKFLHHLPQARFRNFKSISGTSIKYLLVPLVSEVRVRGCWDVSRTSETAHECGFPATKSGPACA